MEQPKARLTLQQSQQAIHEAIWIDASPHEWPTIDKMWLLCSALIDSVQMGDYLRSRLAAVEAERDAARAGEARLTEKADLLDWIEQKIGNVYEGIETVRLHRDDATNSFIVAIGKDSLAGYGHSLVAALRAAKAGGE